MVKCLECEQEFKNAAGLSGHLRLAHGQSGKLSVSVPSELLERIEAGLQGVESFSKAYDGKLELLLAGQKQAVVQAQQIAEKAAVLAFQIAEKLGVFAADEDISAADEGSSVETAKKEVKSNGKLWGVWGLGGE